MSVGPVIGKETIDVALNTIAIEWRELATRMKELNTQVNGAGNGLAFLQKIGYSNAPNPDNPGGVSDAQYAENLIGYYNTNSGIYFGTDVQTTTFSFYNATAPLWGGQV